MAEVLVFVKDGANVIKFKASQEMYVGDMLNDHLKTRTDIERFCDKQLLRVSNGEFVVHGRKLKLYVDEDAEGDKTVSFNLQLPTSAAPPPAGIVGASSVADADAIDMMVAMKNRAKIQAILTANGIAVQERILKRAFVTFGSELENALKFKEDAGIVETYNKAKQCPGSVTLSEFQRQGYQPIGLLDGKSPIITVVHESLLFAVKPLKVEEIERQRTLDARIRALGGHAAPGGVWITPDAPEALSPFRLLDYNDKTYLISPCYRTTLSKCGAFHAKVVSIFFRSILGAFRHLHRLGLAYCDLKPDNVCLKEDGNCVLVDLGSIAQFGEPAMTTIAYLPSDMANPPFVASEELDYWLLARFVWCISGLKPVKNAKGEMRSSSAKQPKPRHTEEQNPVAVTREELIECLRSDVADDFLENDVFEELLSCLRRYMA
jgi:hypothetical protein